MKKTYVQPTMMVKAIHSCPTMLAESTWDSEYSSVIKRDEGEDFEFY